MYWMFIVNCDIKDTQLNLERSKKKGDSAKWARSQYLVNSCLVVVRSIVALYVFIEVQEMN